MMNKETLLKYHTCGDLCSGDTHFARSSKPTLNEHIAAMKSRDVVLEQVTFRQGITLFEMFGVVSVIDSKDTQ